MSATERARAETETQNMGRGAVLACVNLEDPFVQNLRSVGKRVRKAWASSLPQRQQHRPAVCLCRGSSKEASAAMSQGQGAEGQVQRVLSERRRQAAVWRRGRLGKVTGSVRSILGPR